MSREGQLNALMDSPEGRSYENILACTSLELRTIHDDLIQVIRSLDLFVLRHYNEIVCFDSGRGLWGFVSLNYPTIRCISGFNVYTTY